MCETDQPLSTPEPPRIDDEPVRCANSAAASLKKQLAQLEQDCPHDWSDPVYDPEYQKAYTIPGDAPGTMGVDWQGSVDVPAKTTKYWRKTCQKCGKIWTTQRTKMGAGAGGLAREVPDFGSP